MPTLKKKKLTKPNTYYAKAALEVIKEAELHLVSIKRCLELTESFPTYLNEFKELVDILVQLQVAHNVLNNHMGTKPK